MADLDHIPRVTPGDALSAARDTLILEALARSQTGPGILVDSIGTQHTAFQKRRMCRFEMTDELRLPETGSGTADAYFLGWIPDATAADITYVMRWDNGNASTLTAGETITDSSGITAYVVSVTDNGAEGFCVLTNMQGGVMRNGFTFTATGGKTGRIANIYPAGDLDGGPEIITVADTMRMHSKMATYQNVVFEGVTYSDIGAYGIAWIPDDPMCEDPYNTVFEILTMQTPGPFFGELKTDMEHADVYVDVIPVNVKGTWYPDISKITFGGYDFFGPAWARGSTPADPDNADISCINPPSLRKPCEAGLGVGNADRLFAGFGRRVSPARGGSLVFCVWHARIHEYFIVWVEPDGKNWTSLEYDRNLDGTKGDVYQPPFVPPV